MLPSVSIVFTSLLLISILQSWLLSQRENCLEKLLEQYHLFCNSRENICRIILVQSNFSHNFTLSEIEQDYYHQKVNVRVASRVAERLKYQGLRKLGNFKKDPETVGFDYDYPACHPKTNFDIFAKKLQKISCKTFHRKTNLN